MHKLTFKIVKYGSDVYQKAVILREKVLRIPLGLVFSPEELKEEKNYLHVAGSKDKEVVATAVLIPENETLRIRQVAVKKELRGQGIGSAIMEFCESYAKNHGFKEVYLHARDSAVPFYLKNHYFIEEILFEELNLLHRKMRKVVSKLA